MSPGTEDTIAAVSTPPGEGGVGMVRLSGPRAVAVAAAVFRSPHGRDIQARTRQRVFHGHVVDWEGRVLDEVLLHVMRAPHSYTAEDVVEITGHGGMTPLAAILDAVLRCGARPAGPGEFTRRAFLNGRIDLSQAEAVIDQIRARTTEALRAAGVAASGALLREIRGFRESLAGVLAHAEAAVDFPDEDLPDLVNDALYARLSEARGGMARLLETAERGRRYREGAMVVVAGRPNVGKSSLFNALLRDRRALVSEHPGTTRDTIEETADIGGAPVRLVDTAGIRADGGEVEQMGIRLAREKLSEADAVLFVIDASRPATGEDGGLARDALAAGVPVLLARNKSDLGVCPLPDDFPGGFSGMVSVSATTGEGLGELEETMGRMLLGVAPRAGSPMLSRLHQADSLRRALECTDRALEVPAASPELLALELREALAALGEITGETTPEELLDRIFSEFCIGK